MRGQQPLDEFCQSRRIICQGGRIAGHCLERAVKGWGAGEKLKGPASYFPSIEKTYGKPIQHWLDVSVGLLAGKSHMEVVSVLKADHGLGHGHANAIVAYVRSKLGSD